MTKISQHALFDDDEIHMPLEKQMSIVTSKSQYQAFSKSKGDFPNDELDNTPQYQDDEEDDECYPHIDD